MTRGSWYTLANSCGSFSSIIEVPIPLPARNPCKISWNCTTVLIRVSITASTTFYMTSSRPIPQVSVFPFGVINNMVQSSYLGIYPLSHINWISSTSFGHWVGLGVGGGRSLHWICLPQPHLQVFCPQVSMDNYPVTP